MVDLRDVTTAATVGRGGVDSLANSSDDEESASLFGVGVLNDSPTYSPTFSEDNDLTPDSPTDNEVSKYSFYSRLSHYMEGHKISMSNRAAVEICLLSEAGTFARNMDPMKKDKKERAFFAKYISLADEIEDDQFEDKGFVRETLRRQYKCAKKENSPQSLWRIYEKELNYLWTFAKKKRELATWRSCRVDQRSSGT